MVVHSKILVHSLYSALLGDKTGLFISIPTLNAITSTMQDSENANHIWAGQIIDHLIDSGLCPVRHLSYFLGLLSDHLHHLATSRRCHHRHLELMLP